MSSSYTLVIGNKNYSSWSFRAYLMVRHCGVSFTERLLPFETETFTREVAELSPSRRVPVLLCDDRPVWDSLAIAEFLAERFPELWPSDSWARAHARCISAEMHAGFPELRARMPMNVRAIGRNVPRTPGLQYEIARIEAMWNDARARFGADGPWLCGPFSAADCIYAPVATRFRTYGVTLTGEAATYCQRLLAHPHVEAWCAAGCEESWVIEHEEVG